MTLFKEDFLEKIINIHFPTATPSFEFVGTTTIGHRGANPIVLGDTTVSATGATLPESLIWQNPPGTIYPASNTHVQMGGVLIAGLQNLFVDYGYSPSPALPFTITTVWHLTSVAGVITPTINCRVNVSGGALASASKDILLGGIPFGPPVSTDVTATITQNADGSYTVSVV